MSDEKLSLAEKGVTLGAMAATLALSLILFLAAGAILRLTGPSAASAITRVLGVILAALAAQLMLDSLVNTFGQLA